MHHAPDTYRTSGIDLRTSQGNFSYSAFAWKELPIPVQVQFNALAVQMQRAGLATAGKHFNGSTLFMQMNRAVCSVYGFRQWTDVPAVPAPPPAPPKMTFTATDDGTRTRVFLHAAAFASGCQVWVSRAFVPGCRDPFAQRVTMAGALPDGWPDGGADLSGVLGEAFHAQAGMAFVVKIVPVSRDGFVGPPFSDVCEVKADGAV